MTGRAIVAGGGNAIEVRGVGVSFGPDRVLDALDVTIRAGTSVAIVGPSGAGKSTALNVIAGLVEPDRGSVRLPGLAEDLWSLSIRDRTAVRLRSIGLVFQLPTFISDLPLVDNVAFPLVLSGTGRTEARRRALERMEEVGVAHIARSYPDTPSGGELQRAALARAIVGDPPIVLCDEPTGALDEANRAIVAGLIGAVAAAGRTVVTVTHDRELAAGADETVEIRRRVSG